MGLVRSAEFCTLLITGSLGYFLGLLREGFLDLCAGEVAAGVPALEAQDRGNADAKEHGHLLLSHSAV